MGIDPEDKEAVYIVAGGIILAGLIAFGAYSLGLRFNMGV